MTHVFHVRARSRKVAGFSDKNSLHNKDIKPLSDPTIIEKALWINAECLVAHTCEFCNIFAGKILILEK
jgi:hypothetical protein